MLVYRVRAGISMIKVMSSPNAIASGNVFSTSLIAITNNNEEDMPPCGTPFVRNLYELRSLIHWILFNRL